MSIDNLPPLAGATEPRARACNHVYIPGKNCPLCGTKMIYTRIERPKAPLVLDEAAQKIIEGRLTKQIGRVFGLMGVVQIVNRAIGEMDDVDESLYSALLLVEATLEDIAGRLDVSEILPKEAATSH
jgi:hypothetical protein